MAPSTTTWSSSDEAANISIEVSKERHLHNGAKMPSMDNPTKFYTDAYTNGYTDGYSTGYTSGFCQPDAAQQMPIAIVGMSCRLPGNVTTPDEFWELCSRARTGWSEIPKQRFESASFHHPNPGKNGCFNAVGGNFLKEDIGLFDAPFFSLTAQEAISMDPQQRLLLECTFEALDSAGIPKHEIVGKDIGVFIGGSFSEYESQLFEDSDTMPMYQATGCAFAMQSNRISHFFDLRGPSLTLDTACSSSLVALHQACQSLRNKESQAAIVGGCHLNTLPESWISLSQSRLFSKEGRSFSFDSRGTGFGRGEGCGVVVLKPLAQALKDNDVIRSVIVASGINQDGKTPGITMPNGSSQEELIKSVYKNAGLDPKDTGYVEAHGTGTKVGDPIEATALYNVFGEGRTTRNPLFIGSVKSNIGHLEAASGIISVIKSAMMLERGFILPNYDFKKPHEKIPFAEWNLKVPISQRPWPRPKRFVSVNNFGFGGTNAHVVLERAAFLDKQDPDEPAHIPQTRKLFVLSAHDKQALEALMKNTGIYLEQRPEIFQNDLMGNVAYTLGQRRTVMQWRVAITASSSFDLIQSLNSGKITPSREIEPLRVGYIFTGQGAQWNAMGRELYEQYPVFAETINACDKYLALLGASFSLVAELNKDATSSLVNEAHISQPACTAIQLALTNLLRDWGVSPTAVAGHSSGEIGAAYAAGILPLESCMAISYYRGTATIELKKRFPALKGSMMAVGCGKEQIAPLIEQLTSKEVRIACFNSPESLTISGDEPAIDELQAAMEKKEMFNRKLQVDVAYHSHHMKLVAKSYLEYLQALDSPKSTDVRFHSSLLGHVIDGSRLEPSYWVDNLTESVRFAEALNSMCEPIDGHKTGVNMIVEIGPHSALAGPVKQILKACGPNAIKIPYASALIRKRDAVETAQELASALFIKGATLKLGAVNLSRPNKPPTMLVDMPRYPWNHQTRYWHESRISRKQRNRTGPRNDILGTMAKYSNDMEPIWRNILKIDDLPWLQHHQIQSLTILPISGFIAMAIEAASQKAIARNSQYDTFELRDVTISTPLMIGDDGVETTLQLRPCQRGSLVSSDIWDEFKIHSWAASKGWTEHCRGIVATKSKDSDNIVGGRIARETEAALNSAIVNISNGATVPIEKTKFYHDLSELGVSYGSSFQGMTNCQAGDGSSTATITVIDTAQDMPQGYQTSMIIHPTVLEQIIEMYWPILGAGRSSVDTIFLPSSIGRMTVSQKVTSLTQAPGSSLQAFCTGDLQLLHPKPVQVSLFATAANDPSEALITLDDLTISPILDREMSSESEDHRELCYKLDWEPILSPLNLQLPNGTSDGASKVSLSHSTETSPFHPNCHDETSISPSNAASHSNGILNGLSKKTIISSVNGKSRQNDHQNGISNGLSNCTSHSNDHQNGISNDSSNGTAHSKIDHNGQLERRLNGTANGSSNGSSHGSSGVQTGINHLNGEEHAISHTVFNGASGDPAMENIFSKVLVAIVHGRSEHQINLASRLADVMEFSTGKRPDIGTLSDVQAENKLCLFICELDRPLLSTLTEIEFLTLQKLLTRVQGLLWVVRGAYAGSQNPDTNMVTGLSRSIRSESLLKFATLDLDSQCQLALDDTVKAIMKVFEAVFNVKADKHCELEYMERNGAFFTPRVINDDEMNAYVHEQIKKSVLEPTMFTQNDRPLKMFVANPGAFDTLHFIDQSVEETILEDEIEIEVKAIGMNSRDAAVMMGQHDVNDCGVECSGYVTRVGATVTNCLVGDRVAAISLSGGVYSTFARAKAAFALKISDNLSYDDAASIPIAYCTAHYGLMDLARLEKGERVFIHGAGSPVGQAAISLAQMVGADIFASVESSESKLILMSQYGFGEDHIFSSHNIASGPTLCQTICHSRFDVVLNCRPTDADAMREVLDRLNNFGRFVDLENQQDGSRLDNSCFKNNRSFISVDLISIATERPTLIRRLMSDVGKLLLNSTIRPVASINVFPISDIEQAFKMLQSGKTDAKLVVAPRPGDKVKAKPSNKGKSLLRHDASYILIGGTGGLGRSMARWMVGKGARNIVLVSRSGSATGRVKALIDEVAATGANIVVRRCDVADRTSVENLIATRMADMPDVKGVIHGAMVLRDVLFEKMTYDEYITVIESKVQGAWNFHKALENRRLDFFVAISSAAGAVGNRGQAAYSAANTYLNAFVQYRCRLGLPASSIDLTAVSDAGYLAENLDAAAEVAKNLGSDSICEAEVLALLEAAINGRLASACNNHTITGVRITPSMPFWTSDAKFKHLRLAAEAAMAEGSVAQTVSFNAALKAARSVEEAQNVVCEGLLSKLPSVLMLEAEDMDITRSLSNYALDSLVAIEVRNYITREFEANLQVLELLSSGSIETLAKTICMKSKLVSF